MSRPTAPTDGTAAVGPARHRAPGGGTGPADAPPPVDDTIAIDLAAESYGRHAAAPGFPTVPSLAGLLATGRQTDDGAAGDETTAAGDGPPAGAGLRAVPAPAETPARGAGVLRWLIPAPRRRPPEEDGAAC